MLVLIGSLKNPEDHTFVVLRSLITTHTYLLTKTILFVSE